MEEMEKAMITSAIIALVLAGLVFGYALTDVARAHTESILTPIDALDNVVLVDSVENKFIKEGLISKAGGIGIPQITANSTEEFLTLAEDDRIYAFLEEKHHWLLGFVGIDKVYVTLIEDGHMLLICRQAFRGEGLVVVDYTQDHIDFVSPHRGAEGLEFFGTFMCTFMLVGMASAVASGSGGRPGQGP